MRMKPPCVLQLASSDCGSAKIDRISDWMEVESHRRYDSISPNEVRCTRSSSLRKTLRSFKNVQREHSPSYGN